MKKILYSIIALSAVSCADIPAFSQARSEVQAVSQDKFPAAKDSWLKGGAFVDPASIRLVRLGMTKAQVYPLLGPPHFGGYIIQNRWSYLLNFYTGAGNEHITCQLLLVYTKGKISHIAWRNGVCKA